MAPKYLEFIDKGDPMPMKMYEEYSFTGDMGPDEISAILGDRE